MRDGGSLIFNSSVVGLLSDAGIAGYATSKHAIVGLMRTAAREVADRGIRVNSLHPGPVDNRFQHRIEVIATGAPEDRAAELFEERIPLGRHAAPEEIARSGPLPGQRRQLLRHRHDAERRRRPEGLSA